MMLFTWIANWIIEHGQGAPYWHLRGYMDRFWILGARSYQRNDDNPSWSYAQKYYAILRPVWYEFITSLMAIRLHHTTSSDHDRHLHDHAYWNISIVLRGGYWEYMPKYNDPFEYMTGGAEPQICKWRGPGSIVFRRATSRHRLVLSDSSCWSLFIIGKRSQGWGYYVPGYGKVPRQEYFDNMRLHAG